MGRVDNWHFDGSWETKEVFARGMKDILQLFNFICDLKDIGEKLRGTEAPTATAAQITVTEEDQKIVQDEIDAALQETTKEIQQYKATIAPKDGLTQIEKIAFVCDLAKSVQIQVGAVFKSKPAQRGLRKVPVCKEWSGYSNYRTSFTAEGNLKLVKERTESKCIGSLPPNTTFGPALEVKFVLIPADNGIDLEPGVAVLVESRIKELRGACSGKDLPMHVWVNVLKNHVQFANYQGNPVLTQRKLDQQKEQEEKTTLVGARGNSEQTQEKGSTTGPRERQRKRAASPKEYR
jgi:hypothetical protein